MSRRIVFALAMGVLTLIGVLVPAAASAQTATTVQPVSSAGAAAVEFEWDFAVAGTPPPRSKLTCHSSTLVEICWEKAGDHWWVRDLDRDSMSTGVRWFNERNGSTYRKGYCITSLGKGNWGHCNKDYHENSQLSGFPCFWDRSGPASIDCLAEGWGFQ